MKKIISIVIVLSCLLLSPGKALAGSYAIEGGLIGFGLGAGLGLGGYSLIEGSSSTTQGRVITPLVTGAIGFGIGAIVGSTFRWNDYVVAPSVGPNGTGGQLYTLNIFGRY